MVMTSTLLDINIFRVRCSKNAQINSDIVGNNLGLLCNWKVNFILLQISLCTIGRMKELVSNQESGQLGSILSMTDRMASGCEGGTWALSGSSIWQLGDSRESNSSSPPALPLLCLINSCICQQIFRHLQFFQFLKFLLLFNYRCMPFLPIPPPHPS